MPISTTQLQGVEPSNRCWLVDLRLPRTYVPDPGRTLRTEGVRFSGPGLESWLELLGPDPAYELATSVFKARQRRLRSCASASEVGSMRDSTAQYASARCGHFSHAMGRIPHGAGRHPVSSDSRGLRAAVRRRLLRRQRGRRTCLQLHRGHPIPTICRPERPDSRGTCFIGGLSSRKSFLPTRSIRDTGRMSGGFRRASPGRASLQPPRSEP